MGDRNEFVARLFERNRTPLYRFLLRSTGRPDDAEDLTQEVFLRVVRGANGYQARGLERAWLFKIARNLLLDRARRDNSRPEPTPRAGVQEPSTEPRALEVIALNQALRTLTSLEREAVVLRDVVGLSYGEIAEATETNVDAVAARIYRARLGLRAVLAADANRPRDGG
jgi:RNA polymerase sigma-70 factor (ECF subfamily)